MPYNQEKQAAYSVLCVQTLLHCYRFLFKGRWDKKQDFFLFPLTSSALLCLHGFHGNKCIALLVLILLPEFMHQTSKEMFKEN